jgi:hypothetical protein
MKPRRGDRRHHLSPTVGELRKSVKEQDTGSVLHFEARFEHMHPEAVDVIDEA